MKPKPNCDRCEHRAESAIKEFCNNPKSENYGRTPRPLQKACQWTKQKEDPTTKVIERMYHNIKAYDKHVTRHFLRKQTPLQLLNLVHEIDRREFAIELCREHILQTDSVKSLLYPNHY